LALDNDYVAVGRDAAPAPIPQPASELRDRKAGSRHSEENRPHRTCRSYITGNKNIIVLPEMSSVISVSVSIRLGCGRKLSAFGGG